MKHVLIIMLVFLTNDLFSQDTTFTRTYPCRCDTLGKSMSFQLNPLQTLMKKKGINCKFTGNGIETYNFVIVQQGNTSQAIINKYKKVRLRLKLSVLCNINGLKIQMAFQESRPASSSWLNNLTNRGRRFAQEVYDSWKDDIYKNSCKQ